MLPIAKFAMKGSMQALSAILLFSALTVWIAPFGIITGALIALVILRIGVSEGVKVFAAALLINLALSIFLLGGAIPGLASIVQYMLPVVIAAIVLRKTNSLATTLQVVLLMVGVMVVGFHLVVGDPVAWWSQVFKMEVLPALQASKIEISPENLHSFLTMLTMLLAIFLVILWYSVVLLARFWQSALYYPGRFGENFRQLRLPKTVGILAILLGLMGLLLDNNLLIQELSATLMAGLLFQGLAVAHHTVKVKSFGKGWLITVYVLLFIFPQTLLVISTLGLFDIWIDFRTRWEQNKI